MKCRHCSGNPAIFDCVEKMQKHMYSIHIPRERILWWCSACEEGNNARFWGEAHRKEHSHIRKIEHKFGKDAKDNVVTRKELPPKELIWPSNDLIWREWRITPLKAYQCGNPLSTCPQLSLTPTCLRRVQRPPRYRRMSNNVNKGPFAGVKN